jgi:hypothetical protein
MGYDLNIWSIRPFEPDYLPQREKWKQTSDNFWRWPGKGWQLALESSTRVELEDVPQEIAGLLPGIAWLTELNLEGDAPDAAAAFARKSAREIAKAAHGVVEDPQEDAIIAPSGVKRYVPQKMEKKYSVINFSWWFMTEVLVKPEGREALLNLLVKHLPEALPKRYGTSEPPEHNFEDRGMEHLANFLGEHLHETKVWYPHRPVTRVNLSCPNPPGGDARGFRSNLLEIGIESAVLEQPGWEQTLQRLWRAMPRLLAPFYGEVRTIANQVRMGATVGMTALDFLKTSFNQITRGWFWRGIPPSLGHAVVIGPEYQKLWPDFLKHAETDGAFAFATTPRWTADQELNRIIGAVPAEITLLPGEGMGPAQKYPSAWPFAPPFLP